jgi:glyoxylase-like metal-dependent hydrolase (beta-lactamase superfamily II)
MKTALGALALALLTAPAFADAGDSILETLLKLQSQQRQLDGRPVAALYGLPAWQSVPLFSVLDEREDNDPDAYVMTHPWFAFGWSDGRVLVVDAGLALDEAEAFGKPTQWMGGGEMRCDPQAWSPLLEPNRRIDAVVFTHLHTDHTLGVRGICAAQPVPVRLTAQQQASDSRFEAQGRDQLRAESPDCVRFQPWSAKATGAAPSVAELTGFPGTVSVAVPGHTPGSQIIVAFVRDGETERSVVIAGDVVNHRLAFERDVAKPWWYRWFIIREDETAQQRYRKLLRSLDAAGFEIWVNHDLRVPERDRAGRGCSPR